MEFSSQTEEKGTSLLTSPTADDHMLRVLLSPYVVVCDLRPLSDAVWRRGCVVRQSPRSEHATSLMSIDAAEVHVCVGDVSVWMVRPITPEALYLITLSQGWVVEDQSETSPLVFREVATPASQL